MPTRLTRRRALALLGATALSSWRPGGNAAASKAWCRTDPAFLVGDRVVDVVLGSDPAMLLAASGPIELVLTVPVGVPATLLLADAGFGRGYAVAIRESAELLATDRGTQVRVEALAPAGDGGLPVILWVTSLDTDGALTQKEAAGTANAWIAVRGR